MADDDAILEAWQRCRAAHPGIAITVAQFAAYLAARRPAELAVVDQLATYCLDDLYVACGCVAGDRAAVLAVERELVPIIDLALGSWDPTTRDETRQRLRAMLVVDHNGRGPLLAQYSGRGALRRWVRVVAAREASKTRDEDRAHVHVDDDTLFDLLAPPGDPVVSAVKREAAVAVKAAFVGALAELDRRDRTLLRLHLLDGLSIDAIAPMFTVHRATVARWIAAAKQLVLDRTRRTLMRDLRLDAAEVDSMIQLVQSRIELDDGALRSQP